MKRLSQLWAFATKENSEAVNAVCTLLLLGYCFALAAGLYIVGFWFPDVWLTATAFWLAGGLTALFIVLVIVTRRANCEARSCQLPRYGLR